MNKNIPLSGGFGNKKTFPRTRFDSLDDTFQYTGNAGKVVTVRGDGTGLTAQNEAIIDAHTVKVSAADTTPGYLDDKIDTAGLYCILATGLTQTIQTPAGNEELRIAINALHPSIGLDVLLNAPKVNAQSIDASYIALANNDGLPGTPSIRTLGTLSNQAAAGNDSRLSDSRTPTVHAFAGALHQTSQIAAIQSKVSDGILITSAAGEISTLPPKTFPTLTDQVLFEDAADANKKKQATLAAILAAGPWKAPVFGIWDTTVDIPAAAAIGERWIASATGHGWTKDHIYQCIAMSPDLWLDYTPIDGDAVYNASPGMILTYLAYGTLTPHWDESTAKVKSSLSDYSPGYLVAKLEAGIAAQISESGTNPNKKARISVLLGTLSDQAAAGNDIRFTDYYSAWKQPISIFYDPTSYTGGLPLWGLGDRYIATATGFGWTQNRIYEGIAGGLWSETMPLLGYAVYGNTDDSEKGVYVYTGIAGFAWILSSNNKVKITKNDTTPGYLDDKIDTAGLYCILATGLTQTIQTPAGNEELRIAINALHPSIGLDVLLNAPKVNAQSIDASYIALANKDGAPATPSMRTLGTLSSQAAAGNDSRLLKINAIVEPGAATTQVVIYYGTGSPPSAAGLPNGTLFFKYTP